MIPEFTLAMRKTALAQFQPIPACWFASMAVGQPGNNGANAVLHLAMEPESGVVSATTQSQQMEAANVKALIATQKFATNDHALLTVVGRIGQTGPIAAFLVVKVFASGFDFVTPLDRIMDAEIALAMMLK